MRTWQRTEKRKLFPYGTVDDFFRQCMLCVDGTSLSPDDTHVYFPQDRLSSIGNIEVRLSVDWEAAALAVGSHACNLRIALIARDAAQKLFTTLAEIGFTEGTDLQFHVGRAVLDKLPAINGLRFSLLLVCDDPNIAGMPIVCARKNFQLASEQASFEFPHYPESDEWFEAQGFPRSTPWYVKISTEPDFSMRPDEIVAVHYHESLKPVFERLEGSDTGEALVKTMLITAVRTLAIAFAESSRSGDFEPGTAGHMLTKLLTASGTPAADLLGDNASHVQQKLDAWVSARVNALHNLKNLRVISV